MNMKTIKALTFCTLIFFALEAKSQTADTFDDLLVTIEGDSIRGRILTGTKSFISIQRLDLQTERLYAPAVRTVIQGYYRESTDENNENSEIIKFKEARKENNGFRFRFEGGYSYRLGKSPEGPEKISNFRSGYTIGISPGIVFANGANEIGLTADYRKHGYDSDYVSGRVAVHTYFIGPHWNMLSSENHSGGYSLFGIGLGYVALREKYYSMNGKADTFGIKLTYAYGFPLGNESAKMEIRISALNAFINKSTIEQNGQTTTVKYSDPTTIGSLNLTVGFVFGK